MTKDKGVNSKFNLVGKYKFKSVFVRILIFLLLYSSLLLTVLYTYNRYIMRKNVEQRLEIRTLAVLEKTREGIDRELHNLSNQMVQLSKDEYIRAVMTAPNIKNSDRNYNIVYQLQSVKLVNDLVSGAFLYLPSDDTFYSSEGVAVKAEQYKGTGQISQLLEFCRNAKEEVGKQQFVSIGKTQYLLLHAPVFYDRVLGVLAFQIDSNYLNSIIEGKGETGKGNTIWTFDREGYPVFPSQIGYPEELTPETVTHMPSSSELPPGMRGGYYKLISEQNGWQYILRTDADLFQMEASAIDGGLLLIVLALGVFCILFSVYLSRSVYLPIHKLIGIADQEVNGEGETVPQNELELLEKSVSYTVMRNQEMKHFLQNIKPAMISDTFRNLLLGHEIDAEKLDATFAALGTEFSTRLNYTLVIISLTSEDRAFSLLECNILLHRLEQEFTAYAQGRYICSFVHMLENSHMAVVMGFPKTVSAKQILGWKDEQERRIQDICSDYPVRLLTGSSRYLMGITELYRNFSLICQDLKYKIYLQDRSAEKNSAPLMEPDRQLIINTFSSLKEKIDNGEEEEARALVAEVAGQLLDHKNTPEELKAFAVHWWEAVMKELIPLDVFNRDELYNQRTQLFDSLDNRELFQTQLERFNNHVIDGIKSNSRKLKRRYVERARQYIEEHYSESDLSLSAISEFLGISQSYMSTQFKKETGTNFIEYLNRYRIERSKLLLQMTEMTIEEVGFKTGFSSAKNFIRVFKKYEGISPGTYREQ
ncbi:MAG: AraC family transcriptional regulator [Clostridium sp.]|nr:AraC family transcriptional regulator [Clostridium sp.]